MIRVAVAVLSPFVGRLADRIGTRLLVLTGLAAMVLFAQFLSTFAGGSAVAPAGASTASGSTSPVRAGRRRARDPPGRPVPRRRNRPGPVRRAGERPERSGGDALNPLHAHGGAAFSDTFLATAAVSVLALVVAFRMRPGRSAA